MLLLIGTLTDFWLNFASAIAKLVKTRKLDLNETTKLLILTSKVSEDLSNRPRDVTE